MDPANNPDRHQRLFGDLHSMNLQEACLEDIDSWGFSPDGILDDTDMDRTQFPFPFVFDDDSGDIGDCESLLDEGNDCPFLIGLSGDSDWVKEAEESHYRTIALGKLMSDKELSDICLRKQSPPIPPDISKGLGRNRAREDIVNLEKYISNQLILMVYKGELWKFEAPCWKHLDFRQSAMEFRHLLSKIGLSSALTTNEYRAIYQLLLSNPDIQHEEDIEPPPHYLNLRDCTLDLLSMESYSHNPQDGFFSFLNLSFGEIQEMSAGPIFENFVSQVGNGSPLVRQQLLELVALAITGYEAKVFYVLLGPSNTGKTQFGRFLEELLGRENVASLAGVHDFSNRFTTSSLEGKMLATCLDLPDSPLPSVAVGVIKQIVGDDPIKVEAKYKDSRTIYRKPLLLFAGNHPIRIPGIKKEDAFLNRMVVIPFQNPVPPEDMESKLYNCLLEEAPYIVARAIEVYRELLERNFAVTRVPLPDEYAPQDGREGYQAVTQFVSDCCLFQADREIATKSLYLAYQNYADKNSLATISQIEFARKLSDYLQTRPGVTSCKRVRNGVRGYQGIGLRDEWSL